MTKLHTITLTATLPMLCLALTGCLSTHAAPTAAPAAVTPDAARLVRIALVSDTHTTRSDKENKPLYKGRFDKVIAAVNAEHPDVVLIAGDLTDGGLAVQLADFKEQVKGLQGPVLLVPGNHDIGAKIAPGIEGGVTAKRVEAFEAALGKSFYVSHQPGVRIIALNSSLYGSGLPAEAAQWDFLEKELAQPATVPTIIFEHYPPFIKTADEPGGIYWNVEPAPRQRLLDLIQRGHVAAVLTGHLHRPLVNHLNGVAYITTTAVSFGLPADKQPQGWTMVTITPQGEVTSENQYIDG